MPELLLTRRTWEYAAALEADGRTLIPFDFRGVDPYEFFLKQPEVASLDFRTVGHQLPTWRKFIDHPDYDSFWQRMRTLQQMPKVVNVPDLIVAGWWDQEDFFGPLEIFRRQKKRAQSQKLSGDRSVESRGLGRGRGRSHSGVPEFRV